MTATRYEFMKPARDSTGNLIPRTLLQQRGELYRVKTALIARRKKMIAGNTHGRYDARLMAEDEQMALYEMQELEIKANSAGDDLKDTDSSLVGQLPC
ncbi:MAG: hypothetical protein NVS2B16_20070 [Chloroflexota bacterium]